MFYLRQFSVLFALFVAGLSQALAAPAPLRVVVDDNYPPYIFRDGEGRVQGILKDYWDLWAKHSGVRVELTATDWIKPKNLS